MKVPSMTTWEKIELMFKTTIKLPGVSVKQISKETGVSSSSIYKWVRGETDMVITNFLKVSSWCIRNVPFLLGAVGNSLASLDGFKDVLDWLNEEENILTANGFIIPPVD